MDLLLLMAAKENDAPKVAELLRAGADLDVKVGRPLALASVHCVGRFGRNRIRRGAVLEGRECRMLYLRCACAACQGTDGKSAPDLATSDAVQELLEEPQKAFSF